LLPLECLVHLYDIRMVKLSQNFDFISNHLSVISKCSCSDDFDYSGGLRRFMETFVNRSKGAFSDEVSEFVLFFKVFAFVWDETASLDLTLRLK
jgi:hypothetical protein